MNEIIRNFENSKYFGYLFYVSYEGEKFSSFDENPNEISVKSEFRKLLQKNDINIYKGIQQAGRTDKDVSAFENILYINSKKNIKFENLKIKNSDGLIINKVERTIPFLEFPEMIEKRYYVYEYPENLIINDEKMILKKCCELSGTKNFKKFTSKKGEKLKNHIRNINISYENKKLYFVGDGFLPQQVRIMSNFILNNKMTPLDGKYLTLEKVKLNEELEKLLFEDVIDFENLKELSDLDIETIQRIQKNSYFYIFYVDKKKKGEFIGKKGKNIKKLKKIYGNIIVKEI